MSSRLYWRMPVLWIWMQPTAIIKQRFITWPSKQSKPEFARVADLLIDNGANKDAQGSDLETPLQLAAEYGNEEVTKVLLEKGADTAHGMGDRGTPLHLAALNGHFSVAEMLLQNMPDAGDKDVDDATPLHLAAWGGHNELVAMLLTKGANANVQQRDLATPLHVAALRGYATVAQTLLNHGADAGVRSRAGWSAADVADHCGYLDLAQMLRRHLGVAVIFSEELIDRSDARRLITTLANQIIEFVGDQAKVRMDQTSKQEVQSLPLSELFDWLITRPLMTLNGVRITIAIDALDELRADVDELCKLLLEDVLREIMEDQRFRKMLSLVICTREFLSIDDLSGLTGRRFDLSPQFKWRKNLDFSSDFKNLWAEKFDLNVIDAETALFQGCVDVMVENRSLFNGKEARIVGGFQDPPTEVRKEVAYACRHWYSHLKATAGNLLSSQDLGEFLAIDSFGPGLLVRGVRDNDEDVIRLAFGCSHDSHTEHSKSEKEKNHQLLLAAEASMLLPLPLLHEGAKRNRVSICRLLLDCGGADVNTVCLPPSSGTALHAAARARADDVFGLLLDKGVDPQVLDAEGRTVSDLYPEYFEMLERKAKRKETLQ
ncbi:hypothetical protein HK405_006408, partial [Cladochytrium tenue]